MLLVSLVELVLCSECLLPNGFELTGIVIDRCVELAASKRLLDHRHVVVAVPADLPDQSSNCSVDGVVWVLSEPFAKSVYLLEFVVQDSLPHSSEVVVAMFSQNEVFELRNRVDATVGGVVTSCGHGVEERSKERLNSLTYLLTNYTPYPCRDIKIILLVTSVVMTSN